MKKAAPDASLSNQRITITDRQASAADGGSTLLPMLIWGLILITVGMIALMMVF